MEYLNYLIYPIAGLLAFLALGGLNTRQPVVVVASVISLALNGYAILHFVWWPILLSFVSDFLLKALYGDPGAEPRVKVDESANALDLYLVSGLPLVVSKLNNPIARIGLQVFIFGMVDMKRSAETLSLEEFISSYDSLLARYDISSLVPTEVLVQTICRAASEKEEVASLIRQGAMSIKNYIVEGNVDAVADLLRAVMYAEKHELVFSPLLLDSH